MKIKGKLVLITGASFGMGEATAREVGRLGGHIILLARSESRLKTISDEICQTGGKAEYYAVDLSQPAAIADIAQKISTELGIPDILINNAGAGRWLTIEQTETSELEQMMMLPYFAAFNLTRELLPHMRNRGSGQIINVTSPASFLVWPGAAGYAAARAAMASFNKSLQLETHTSGINVTLAVFGKVASSYWQHNPGSEDKMPKVNTYLPTLTPQNVASAIAKAINRNRQLVIEPKILRPLFFFNSIAPGITGKILRMGWKGGI